MRQCRVVTLGARSRPRDTSTSSRKRPFIRESGSADSDRVRRGAVSQWATQGRCATVETSRVSVAGTEPGRRPARLGVTRREGVPRPSRPQLPALLRTQVTRMSLNQLAEDGREHQTVLLLAEHQRGRIVFEVGSGRAGASRARSCVGNVEDVVPS